MNPLVPRPDESGAQPILVVEDHDDAAEPGAGPTRTPGFEAVILALALLVVLPRQRERQR